MQQFYRLGEDRDALKSRAPSKHHRRESTPRMYSGEDVNCDGGREIASGAAAGKCGLKAAAAKWTGNFDGRGIDKAGTREPRGCIKTVI